MPLSSARWVFFRDTREGEQYVAALHRGMGDKKTPFPEVEQTAVVAEAIGFDTAAEAYELGKRMAPYLDHWRVGLRG